ncbi:MAG: MarC family protein [Rhodocyclaceae bacterium]|nr:MarC family protein [Pseudomonadota bacterium]MDQ7971772.1 MarC family protein [Rhodocyclaceae bacterium]MDQ8001201.1 MarC family protein [Pseudomonadota bacterium]MDQ8016718.1 MarC family protein [Pseudomonadota bacterium]
MTADIHTFIHLLFIGVVALFPVVNPVGTAFVVMPSLALLDPAGRRRAVGLITLYAFCLCTVALVAGGWILKLFGLSIPVVQLGGGIMICKMGWEFLASDKKKSEPADDATAPAQRADIDDQLFYPLTFPLTTGAGTVSVLLTLSAHGASETWERTLLSLGAIQLAIVAMCAMVYFFYLNTQRLQHYLGSRGEQIFNRLMAFFIFCVGLQIATSGAKALLA